MTAGPELTRRAPGRPRSAGVDRAILTATLDLLSEVGIAGLSIEQVAAKAGVGKATVYRRWRTKDELVGDALASLSDPVPELPGKSVRDDLVTLVDLIRRRSDDTPAGRLLAMVSHEKGRHPDVWQRYQQQVIHPRRAALRAVLQRGVATGELRPDLDLDAAALLVAGGMLTAVFHWERAGPVPPGLSERLVDAALAGLASPSRA